MSGHTPWSEIEHKSTPEQRAAAKQELDAWLELESKARHYAEAFDTGLEDTRDVERDLRDAALRFAKATQRDPADVRPLEWRDGRLCRKDTLSECIHGVALGNYCDICREGI